MLFRSGAGYGCLLLMPAVIAFLFDLLSKDDNILGYYAKGFELNRARGAKFCSYVFCAVFSGIVLLPVLSFGVLGLATDYPNNLAVTISNIGKAMDLKAGRYLANSVVIALLASLLGVAMAFITAYLTARMKSKVSKMLHLISITSAAVPGIVLGLSYVLVFKGSFIYGTIIILVMVNLIQIGRAHV